MHGDTFLSVADGVKSAATFAPVITGDKQLAPVNDLAVADEWRTLAVLGIIGANDDLGNGMGCREVGNLTIETLRAAMNPSRVGMLFVDGLQVGCGGNLVAVACETNVDHVRMITHPNPFCCCQF